MGVVPNANDLPPGSQPWKRWVDNTLAEQGGQIGRHDQDQANALNALSTTVKVLGDQITAVPVIRIVGDSSDSFGLNGNAGAWTAYAQTGFIVPKGKPKVQVFVSVTGVVVDTTTNNTTHAEGRINFGGVLSRTFYASKDASVTTSVTNLINGSHYYSYPNLLPGAYYALKFELRGINTAAFPPNTQNYASINVIASHTG